MSGPDRSRGPSVPVLFFTVSEQEGSSFFFFRFVLFFRPSTPSHLDKTTFIMSESEKNDFKISKRTYKQK